jgi:outer membrane receptor protein involved in Fe transport
MAVDEADHENAHEQREAIRSESRKSQEASKMNIRNLARYLRLSASARIFAALVLIFTGSIIAFGQQITGSIVGTVKDQQGALVTTATVKAINVDTGFTRSAPANDYGQYRIDFLPVGKYTVEAAAAGFQRFVQQNIALNVDQTLTVDIPLVVGAQSLTITVTEAPPTINTSDAVLGRTIEPDEIIGLPLVNRNVYSELSLVPGVMANNQSPTSNPTGAPQMTVGIASTAVQVNGSLDSGNGTVAFYLDGGNNITGMRNYGNPAPNPDAIEEFRVETSAFSAQYGQFSAAVISVITKSGTNKFHGSLFEFNRNTDFNAWQWIAPPGRTASSVKAPYHRNQFGGTFGGPVKHDKAFFFFSYAGLRMVQGSVVSGGVVPTAAERLGDFTADPTLTTLVYMPGTAHIAANLANGANAGPGCSAALISAATAGHCLPTASLDKTAANFLNINNTIGVSVPLPTGAQVTKTGGGTYSTVYVQPTNTDEYLGKFDENLGSKDHVGVTYFYANTATTPSGGGNINWTGNQSRSKQTNANISDVHTFSASTANQAWLTFTRAMGGRVLIPVTGPANQTLTSFGSNFLLQGPAGLPYLTGAGFQTGNPNAGPVTGSDNYELRDMVTITKGKHNLSLGGEYALEKTMFAANLNNYGDLSFSTSAPTSTGVAIADFDTGQLSAFEQDSTYITHLSTWHYAVFAQDNYRVTSRLTLNLGLRWDIDTPPVDSHDRTASFVPGVQSTVVTSTTSVVPKGMLFPGDAGIGRGIIGTQYSHISPRLGVAWDPFGDGKTAVRAAAGIFYGLPSGNEWNQPGNAMPFSLRNGFGSETSMTNIYNVGFPSTAPGGGIFPYIYTPSAPKFYASQSIEAIPPSFKDSSVYQFNLSIQRQLPARISVTTAYVGTLGRHLSSFLDANYAPYSTVANGGGTLVGGLSTAAASQEQRRQYDAGINLSPGTLSGITYLISDQTSNYNGLQISATKAMSRGFSISGFYVWSRALESSNPVENGGMNNQDPGVIGKPFTAANDHGMLDQNGVPIVGGGLHEERGLMDQNHDNNAAFSGMWKIDYYRGSNKIVKGLVNGWTISPVIYLISGGPFTVSTGSNKNFDTAGQSRPNGVPGVSPKLNPHRCRVCGAAGQSQTSVLTAWFNSTYSAANTTVALAQAAGQAFMLNGPGQPGGIGPGGADGNVGRDSLIGPGLKDMDAGLLKDIKLYRDTTFQFRAEVTNVMNWVNLNNPSAGNITSGSQGTITGAAGTQRVIQLGGRLTF